MVKIPVYFMPGMAASPQIFEHFDLPDDLFSTHFLQWILPERNESIRDYSKRLLEQIHHDYPVLVGVSFGGMIVQEVAKLIEVRKVVIISSAKSHHEYPRRMQVARKTGLHRLLPFWLISKAELLVRYNPGIARKKLNLYYKYLGVNDPSYLRWAVNEIVHWTQEERPKNLLHIHGTHDPIFPVKYLGEYIPVNGGTHIIVVNRFKWFNEHLPQLLQD